MPVAGRGYLARVGVVLPPIERSARRRTRAEPLRVGQPDRRLPRGRRGRDGGRLRTDIAISFLGLCAFLSPDFESEVHL